MRRALSLLFLLGLAAPRVWAGDWLETTTEHFTFIYEAKDTEVAQRFMAMSTEVFQNVTRYLNYTPTEKIPVILSGRTDTFNGYFTFAPERLNLFLASPDSEVLGAYNTDYLKNLFVHELTHYVHLTKPLGKLAPASSLFGRWLLVGNLALTPGWMLEGITTNTEGIFADGGRARNPFFEMTWKAPLHEGKMWDFDKAGYSSYQQPWGRIYSSGFFMVRYLREKYGEDQFMRLYERFVHEYGWFPLVDIGWALKDETGFFQQEFYAHVLEDLKSRYPTRPTDVEGQRISPQAPGQWYLPTQTSRGWYGYAQPQNRAPGLYSWGTDELPHLDPQQDPVFPLSLQSPFDVSLAPDGRSILFAKSRTTQWEHVPEALTGMKDLWWGDLSNGSLRALTHDGGWKDPALSPDGRAWAAVKSHYPWTSLVLGSLKDEEQKTLAPAQEGTLFEKPSFSPDGLWLAVVENRRGVQGLGLFSADGTQRQFIRFENSALYQPRWSSNTRLTLAAELDGTLQSYLVDLETQKVKRLTSDPVGAVSSVLGETQVVYSTWTSEGYAVKTTPRVSFPADPVYNYLLVKEELNPPSPSYPTSPTQNHLDFPRPFGWLPLIDLNIVGSTVSFRGGLQIMAASLLETQSANLFLFWDHQIQQLSASFDYQFKWGGLLGDFQVDHEATNEQYWDESQLQLELPLVEADNPFFTNRVSLFTGASWGAASTWDYSQSLASALGFAGFSGGHWYRALPLLAFFGGSGLAYTGQVSYHHYFSPDYSPFVDLRGNLDLSVGLGVSIFTVSQSLWYSTSGSLVGVLNPSFFSGSSLSTPWRYGLKGGFKLPIGLEDIYVAGSAWLRQGLGLWMETGLSPSAAGTGTWDSGYVLGLEMNTSLNLARITLPFFIGVKIKRPWDAPFSAFEGDGWALYLGSGTASF